MSGAKTVTDKRNRANQQNRANQVNRAILLLNTCLCLSSVVARPATAQDPGNLTGDADIRAHVDRKLHGLAPTTASWARLLHSSRTTRRRNLIGHLAMSAQLMVPIYGSWALENAVFGALRPAGILTDWVAGAALPLALVGGGLYAGRRGRSGLRSGLLWSALGCYLATRIGMLIVGNDHVSVHNARVREVLRL